MSEELLQITPLRSIDKIEFGHIQPAKKQVEKLAMQIESGMAEGWLDPIETIIHLTAIGQVCEDARKLCNHHVVDALEKEKGKAEKFGCKIESAEVGTKYDYSVNEDWVKLNDAEKEIADKRKELEKRLKLIPQGKSQVDMETGETLIGPAKTSTTSFKITIGK